MKNKCNSCEHCKTQKFICTRCGINITVKTIGGLSHQLNELLIRSYSGSAFLNNDIDINLCDKCVIRLYNFLGIKIIDTEQKHVIVDTFGNKIEQENN